MNKNPQERWKILMKGTSLPGKEGLGQQDGETQLTGNLNVVGECNTVEPLSDRLLQHMLSGPICLR